MERRINRRDLLKLAGAAGIAAVIPTSERLTPEKKFFHNESIGIEMSQFLDGIIDLKYFNKERGEWTLYNNIVPEVYANGKLNNAEMFGLETRINLISDDEEGQEIEIEYGKFEEETWVGENHWTGNGAKFSVFANIPKEGQHITFRLEEQEGSAPIERVALTNFFGAAEKVRYLSTADGIEDALSAKHKDMKDGVHKLGKFVDFPLPHTEEGDVLVTFGDSESEIIQYQKISDSTIVEGTCELRETPWTEEQSEPGHPYNPGRRWFEMVQVMQPYSPEATWTFGYEFRRDVAWDRASTHPHLLYPMK